MNIRNDISEAERDLKVMDHRSLVSGDFVPVVGADGSGDFL
jgi:hypothetical protein